MRTGRLKFGPEPGSQEFFDAAIVVAAHVVGVHPRTLRRSGIGNSECRSARWALVKYFRTRGLTWEMCGAPFGIPTSSAHQMGAYFDRPRVVEIARAVSEGMRVD